MESITAHLPRIKHSWLKQARVVIQPKIRGGLLEEALIRLKEQFNKQGHILLETPQDEVDIWITTADFNQPVNWREAPMFVAKRLHGLKHHPTVFTLVQMNRAQFAALLEQFEKAAAKSQPDPADYQFPGLAESAYLTLHEQGKRAGAILSLVRLLQSQTMSIRVILIIGEKQIEEAYTFDLVGAHPRTEYEADGEQFYEDLVLRMVTAVSTHEITQHQVIGEPITQAVWQSLSTPEAMRLAGKELGRRQFFTRMVEVGNLVNVPLLNQAIASQYSEGCFATWEPQLGALITTVTGSARPVEKDNLSDNELAVVVAMRQNGCGALLRHVEGKRNDPPSSEAVEMIGMDNYLPHITLQTAPFAKKDVPVARSKLHGHRGIKSFDPQLVEHIYLDAPYYHFPVSCSTHAQAAGIMSAFARSEALQHPDDPRQLVFAILAGHGVVIVEKWATGKTPFQLIWEAMDQKRIEIDPHVPQGPIRYAMDQQGRMVLVEA
ncbi:MAG: hypothetical protein HPY45_11925 [Anaerolineae bacterium]|nr:hypothetical protein [Anaerolineae bacterium]